MGGAALMAMIALALLFRSSPKVEASYSFAGCALRPGAAYAREQTIALASDVFAPGALSLIDERHPLTSQTGSVRDVATMTGQYLPALSGVKLMPEVIYALCDLRAARTLEGMTITRGATSFAEQTALQREAYMRYAQVYAPLDSARMAEKYVPAAGHSEHQSGWAFDIELTGTLEMGLADRLRQSDFGVWLKENMWRYGFIERYPNEKAAHFSSGCEGLHLRYVGREHALAMRGMNLCLEEYIALLHAKGSVLIEQAGKRAALIVCMPLSDAQTLMIPRDAAVVSAYGDNAGYAVIVLK